jgi:hypothetical protein
MGENRNAYRVLVGNQEGKRTLGRTRRMGRILKWILKVIDWGGMDWIHLAQDRTTGKLL